METSINHLQMMNINPKPDYATLEDCGAEYLINYKGTKQLHKINKI